MVERLRRRLQRRRPRPPRLRPPPCRRSRSHRSIPRRSSPRSTGGRLRSPASPRAGCWHSSASPRAPGRVVAGAAGDSAAADPGVVPVLGRAGPAEPGVARGSRAPNGAGTAAGPARRDCIVLRLNRPGSCPTGVGRRTSRSHGWRSRSHGDPQQHHQARGDPLPASRAGPRRDLPGRFAPAFGRHRTVLRHPLRARPESAEEIRDSEEMCRFSRKDRRAVPCAPIPALVDVGKTEPAYGCSTSPSAEALTLSPT